MKKLKRILLLILLFNDPVTAQGINDPISIHGLVKDSATGAPVEYATVFLMVSGRSKPAAATLTDINGRYLIKAPEAGTYILYAEGAGFYRSAIEELDLKRSGTSITKDLLLLKKEIVLDAATVTSSKKIIENRLDKLVYNADKDVTAQGGSTSDLLRKIPGVTVDIDGNVELLGNPSIRFLINGKPSVAFGASVADALQSIPSSQIQTIEVITSPGARYDASGTGGIINIILKKSKLEGFNGNISLAAGTRLENGNINAGLKKNKIAFNAFFGGNAQIRAVTPFSMDRISYPGNGPVTSRLQQFSDASTLRNGYKSGLSAEWTPSKTTTVNASIGFNHMENRSKGGTDQYTTIYDNSGNTVSYTAIKRNTDSRFFVNGMEHALSFKKTLNKKGSELSVSYNGSFGHNNTFYDQLQRYTLSGALAGGSKSLNPGIENELIFSADYSDPVNKKLTLETGISSTITNINSDADVEAVLPASGNYVLDSMQSYRSDYHRQVYAAYLSFSFPLSEKTAVKAGMRAEHTDNQGNYSNSGKASLPSYNNYAPSFVIIQTLRNNSSLKFAFTYRLERPDFRDLNPFMNLSDPHNITTGNPHLQAEIAHNFELTWLRSFDNGITLSIVANNQKNSPDIKPYTTYYSTYKIGDSVFNDVTVTTRDNIASEIRRGINISLSVPAGKKISTRTNVMVFNRHLKNIHAVPVITDAAGFRVNMTTTWQASKTFVAEAFGNYNLGMRWQGRQPSVFSYTLGCRKLLMKNKGSLGFVATVPFNKYVNQRSVQEAAGFTSNIFRQVPYRSFGISFTWKFGKLKVKQPKEQENYLYTPPSEGQ